MKHIETVEGFATLQDFEVLQLRKGDEVIHEENVSDLADVLFEDVENDAELEESADFLEREIFGDLREKRVPSDAAISFAELAVWKARNSRNKTW